MTQASQIIIFITIIFSCRQRNILTNAADGQWNLLLSDIGIPAMHMQLLYTDKVVIFDRTDAGRSNISLPNGICRTDPYDLRLKVDCTAHSVEYDVASNSVRPLMVDTDVWCSSGGVLPDGTLLQTGGYNDGDHVIRMYTPCTDGTCDWVEIPHGLTRRRWYATNHILPDGREIIVGGRREFSYEFFMKSFSFMDMSYDFPFLRETYDPEENNLYPFVFLNGDGNLFIFANNRAILFNYKNRTVVKRYPTIPSGEPRNYPSTGSAVLLPLKNNDGHEVMICGGAPKGSFHSANEGNFVDALNTCGRIRINDINPQWFMETMPIRRVMGDMLLLPNGKVLIINGASSGTAGWELARNPALYPVMYRPDYPIGSRFEVQNPSSRPRLYHSSAILLRDGRVLVGGNNPHILYRYTGVLFPTDLTLEAFSPFYLDPKFADLRPTIISPGGQIRIGYGQQFQIRFSLSLSSRLNGSSVMVTMVAPSFATHTFSMNQRLLILNRVNIKQIYLSTYDVGVVSPSSGNHAPAGYYLIFVVHNDIPSEGIWIHIE